MGIQVTDGCLRMQLSGLVGKCPIMHEAKVMEIDIKRRKMSEADLFT